MDNSFFIMIINITIFIRNMSTQCTKKVEFKKRIEIIKDRRMDFRKYVTLRQRIEILRNSTGKCGLEWFWLYLWRLKMTAIKFALQMKMEGLSNILLQCLENSGHISTERNTAFDCAFDGCKIYWWKNEMNKNCGIFTGNSDFQGKMDRYGKTGTVWKIEKNIYNQEQICYGIKVIQEKTVYFRCRRVTYFTKILHRISRKFP